MFPNAGKGAKWNLQGDDLEEKKVGQYDSESEGKISIKSEEHVCRICLGTEEEGQDLINEQDFDLVNGMQ